MLFMLLVILLLLLLQFIGLLIYLGHSISIFFLLPSTSTLKLHTFFNVDQSSDSKDYKSIPEFKNFLQLSTSSLKLHVSLNYKKQTIVSRFFIKIEYHIITPTTRPDIKLKSTSESLVDYNHQTNVLSLLYLHMQVYTYINLQINYQYF